MTIQQLHLDLRINSANYFGIVMSLLLASPIFSLDYRRDLKIQLQSHSAQTSYFLAFYFQINHQAIKVCQTFTFSNRHQIIFRPQSQAYQKDHCLFMPWLYFDCRIILIALTYYLLWSFQIGRYLMMGYPIWISLSLNLQLMRLSCLNYQINFTIASSIQLVSFQINLMSFKGY